MILVLFDGLTADDLHDRRLPHLAALAKGGRVGLMNTAVAGPKSDTAAVLTLALGALAPAEPTDEDIYLSDERVEGATAAVVFRRRTGLRVEGWGIRWPGSVYNPVLRPSPQVFPLLHLGIAPLTRRGLNDKLVGAVLAKAGKECALPVGDRSAIPDKQRRAGLFVVQENGIGAAVTANEAWNGQPPFDLVVDLQSGTQAALDAFLATLPLDKARVLLVSPRPPLTKRGAWQERLTPVVLAGAGVTPGLLTSATTRTPGLIANSDIAPMLLTWLGVPVPATMTGHPISYAPSVNPLADVMRLDRIVTLNARALVPVFVLLSVCAFLIIFGGLWMLWQRPGLAPRFAFGVLFLTNMPLAMMLNVPILDFWQDDSVLALVVCTLGLMALLAGVQTIPSSLHPFIPSSLHPFIPSSLHRLALWTGLAILLDAFFGQPLVKFSLFSAYQIQGLRFYGIGNEYMGVLIGVTLLGAFLARASASIAGAVFLFVAFVIGFPRLGANAGGLVAAAGAFGTGWMILRGRRAAWGAAAAWTLLGLAVAFGFAALERVLPGGGAPSHLGGALQTAGARGYGYLLEIVERKLMMNARLLVHPAILTTLTGFAALALFGRGALRERTGVLFARHPDWARGLPAAGWGALTAFLFNDSGIVVAVFLFGAFLVSGLYFLFADAAG